MRGNRPAVSHQLKFYDGPAHVPTIVWPAGSEGAAHNGQGIQGSFNTSWLAVAKWEFDD